MKGKTLMPMDLIDGNEYEDRMFEGPCIGCKHLHPDRFESDVRTCDAFPEAIPLEIFGGDVDHDVPRPELGQRNGIVFESRR